MVKIKVKTRVQYATFGPVKPTRYPELAYQMQGAGNWRFLDMSDITRPDVEPSSVGPQYRTQAELLADLTRYAEFFGC